MIKSEIRLKGDYPVLYVDGVETAPVAYTTYFEENARYEEFASYGFKQFFVNVSTTTKAINTTHTDFSPFRVGVFDGESPDYSEFEDSVRRILAVCPDALIYPRINISMPSLWVEKNPGEVVETPVSGKREMLFSDAFRRDGKELLCRIMRHILESDYADRIVGWQICAGGTQEWVHFDSFGSLCPNAQRYYSAWVKERYGEDAALPEREEFLGADKLFVSENARRYAEFCSVEIAKTLSIFAKAAKEEVGFSQVVGAFYGYSMEILNPLQGSHALREVIDSPYIDFFCSPASYMRDFGSDSTDMIAVDSLKRRGKLYYSECDHRTYLTKSVQDSRPGVYPDGIYSMKKPDGTPSVWQGPPTAELSVCMLQKAFAHQVTKGSGIWWFDMWGGWYSDEKIMSALTEMRDIHAEAFDQSGAMLKSEIAVFSDERAYSKSAINYRDSSAIRATRAALSVMGAPFDCLAVEDAQSVLGDYRVAVFPTILSSEAGEAAKKLCCERGIPFICASPENPSLTYNELKSFIEKAGVHIYTDEPDPIFVGNGYIGYHSAKAGRKTLYMPVGVKISPIFCANDVEVTGNTVSFILNECETALFRVKY